MAVPRDPAPPVEAAEPLTFAPTRRRRRAARPLESAVTSLGGGALAWLTGRAIGWAWPCAVVGALSGAVAGWRGIYRWTSPAGCLAFVVDSTWALLTTAGALVAHAVAFVQREPRNFRAELSERRGRHVYARGLTIRRGFLLTVGNTVNGAGPSSSSIGVVERHEQVHVWQARGFGPLFPVLYGGWMIGGALVGAASWAGDRQGRLRDSVEAWAYYRNPFEWWAYSREGRWPPPRADAATVWRRAVRAPLARR